MRNPAQIKTEISNESVRKLQRAFVPRAVTFLLLFVLLQVGWQGVRDMHAADVLVHHAIVSPAALLVRILTPGIRAHAINLTLQAPGGGITIAYGCEGSEILFLLLAAFVVAPIPWRSRVAGFLTGIGVVFVINLARIVVLFYANRADYELFDLLHRTVTPIAVVLLVAAYFYAWLVYATRRMATTA